MENKAKFLLWVQMISRSVSRAAAATLPNYFPPTHPCPGFPKPGCRDVAIQPAVAQALSMPVALDPVAVAGINLIKPFVTVHGFRVQRFTAERFAKLRYQYHDLLSERAVRCALYSSAMLFLPLKSIFQGLKSDVFFLAINSL